MNLVGVPLASSFLPFFLFLSCVLLAQQGKGNTPLHCLLAWKNKISARHLNRFRGNPLPQIAFGNMQGKTGHLFPENCMIPKKPRNLFHARKMAKSMAWCLWQQHNSLLLSSKGVYDSWKCARTRRRPFCSVMTTTFIAQLRNNPALSRSCLSAQKGNTNTTTTYSAVQINVVNGCASMVLVHATFDHVYLDSRVQITKSLSPSLMSFVTEAKVPVGRYWKGCVPPVAVGDLTSRWKFV